MSTATAPVSAETAKWGGAGLVAGSLPPLTAMALQVGTGGAATPLYYRKRGAKGYPVARYNVPSTGDHAVFGLSPADNLARIRSILNPTMTKLARVLNVSRQAIYDWQSGGSITAENAAKLADLVRAADVFAAEGLTTTHQILNRQFAGRSFFDKVRAGESAEDAARLLLKNVRRELEQRQALADRLKGRTRPAIFPDDIGTPHVSEQG